MEPKIHRKLSKGTKGEPQGRQNDQKDLKKGMQKMRLEKRRKNSKFWPEGCQNGWRQIRGRGGTSGPLIPEVRGTRGSLPEGTSQPDDPCGVGGSTQQIRLESMLKIDFR